MPSFTQDHWWLSLWIKLLEPTRPRNPLPARPEDLPGIQFNRGHPLGAMFHLTESSFFVHYYRCFSGSKVFGGTKQDTDHFSVFSLKLVQHRCQPQADRRWPLSRWVTAFWKCTDQNMFFLKGNIILSIFILIHLLMMPRTLWPFFPAATYGVFKAWDSMVP